MTADAAKIDAEQPWNSPDAPQLDRRSAADWLLALKVSDRCKYLIALDLAADNGVALDRQSYLANLAMVKGGGLEAFWTASEAFRCRGGNQQLAQVLALDIGNHRIHTGLPAVSIQSRGNSALVTTADGKATEADDVILTIPPSVWPKLQIYPPFPDALAPQMGLAMKFLLGLEKPIWKQLGRSAHGYTDRPISMTWEQTAGQRGPGECLCAFSAGPAAEAARALAPEDRSLMYRQTLNELYPGIDKVFAGGAYFDWPGDPATAAGYSFPAPGQVTTIGPLLQKPHGRIHFAGEYASYKFAGYMEGALSTGVAVARRIAQRDGVRV
jgi:monoamine oxidase